VRPEEMGAYEFAPADLPTPEFLQAACSRQKAAQRDSRGLSPRGPQARGPWRDRLRAGEDRRRGGLAVPGGEAVGREEGGVGHPRVGFEAPRCG
jgi:hypothetical protein